MQSEKSIEQFLVREIKKRKGFCIKLLATYFNGLPDRLILLPNKYILFIELKSEGKKPKPIQTIVHNKLRAIGFIVYVVDKQEQINNILYNYDKWYAETK